MSRYKLPAIGGAPSFGRSTFSGAAALSRLVVVRLLDYLELYRQRHALEALDDRMLKDIGITRCDVEREISRPFWR